MHLEQLMYRIVREYSLPFYGQIRRRRCVRFGSSEQNLLQAEKTKSESASQVQRSKNDIDVMRHRLKSPGEFLRSTHGSASSYLLNFPRISPRALFDMNRWDSLVFMCLLCVLVQNPICDCMDGIILHPNKNHVSYYAEEPILVGPDQIYNGKVYQNGQPLVGPASNIIFDGDVYLTTDSELMTSNLLRDHHPVLHLFSPSEAVRKEVHFAGPKKVIRKSFMKGRRSKKSRLIAKPRGTRVLNVWSYGRGPRN